jgi:hypothetical protein
MESAYKNQEEHVVKSNHCARILAISNAMLICFSSASVEAGQSKEETKQAEEQATSNASSNEVENRNAQWSADPERGWVRTDERPDLNDQGESVGKANPSKGKQKGNPKSKPSETSTK